jgi:hypothetical protein
MSPGTFVRSGPDAAPLEGPGTITVLPEGLRVEGRAVRSTLVLVLSGLTGFIVMVAAVVASMLVLDELDRVTDGDSLRPAVTIGIAALVGGYAAARAVLTRVLPLRRVDHVLPFAYLVSAAAGHGVLALACSARACAGRITFHTADPSALLQAITAAKAAMDR